MEDPARASSVTALSSVIIITIRIIGLLIDASVLFDAS